MARIGILGGTFNPPHIGHVLLAQEAHHELGLDVVVLVPTALPPHKPVPDDPGPERRFEMCRLVAERDERLGVSRIELDRPGPSFTVDTLTRLHEDEPEDELIFIVGGDMAQSLPTWREPERILGLATLAVAERSGAARDDVLATLAPLGGRVEFLDLPRVDVSSSMVRRRCAAGAPIRYLVPEEVARYIGVEGLYAGAVATA